MKKLVYNYHCTKYSLSSSVLSTICPRGAVTFSSLLLQVTTVVKAATVRAAMKCGYNVYTEVLNNIHFVVHLLVRFTS